jgi:hypothetical protein
MLVHNNYNWHLYVAVELFLWAKRHIINQKQGWMDPSTLLRKHKA